MPISPEEIASKSFLVTVRGYDRAEVDAYLRAVASDHARVLRRLEELEEMVGAVRSLRDQTGPAHELASVLEDAAETVAASKERLASLRARAGTSDGEPNADSEEVG